jgi:hypothetical protein
MRSNALLYSIKVWLTSAAVGPLIYFGSTNLLHCHDDEFLGNSFLQFLTEGYMFIVFFGALLSSITWAIFYFLIKMVVIEMFPGAKHPKLIIALLGVLLTIGTFLMMPGGVFSLDGLCVIGSYALIIGVGSLLYNLNIEYEPKTGLK